MVAVKRPAPSDAAPEKKAAVQKQQQPQPMEEEDFPRGGGGGLSALQKRELREEGAAEAECEFAAGGSAQKRRKREVNLHSSALMFMCISTLLKPSWSFL